MDCSKCEKRGTIYCDLCTIKGQSLFDDLFSDCFGCTFTDVVQDHAKREREAWKRDPAGMAMATLIIKEMYGGN